MASISTLGNEAYNATATNENLWPQVRDNTDTRN